MQTSLQKRAFHLPSFKREMNGPTLFGPGVEWFGLTPSLLKEQHPSLKGVHSQVLQNVAVRIDLAFKAFFRRIKAGETPGFPRFRGADRYDSFTFPQSGFSITHDTRVCLPRSAVLRWSITSS